MSNTVTAFHNLFKSRCWSESQLPLGKRAGWSQLGHNRSSSSASWTLRRLSPTSSRSSWACPGRFEEFIQQQCKTLHPIHTTATPEYPYLPTRSQLQKIYIIIIKTFGRLSTYQLLAIVVALYNAVVRDANWHHQYVWDGTGAQRVHHDGQHSCARCRRLPAAGAGTLKVHLQKLLLT